MKAAICTRYGSPDVVVIEDLSKPEASAGELLIRVRASTVDVADARIRALRAPRGLSWMMRPALGFFKPRKPVLGMAFAGEIEAVGAQVSRFKVGDKVFGTKAFDFGCHAEYVTLEENGAVAAIPESLNYAEAAALLFGAMTAVTFFRCGNLKRGEKVLINGASGAVGSAAVQIAKHHIGAEVTGVCSEANGALVTSLGANGVIDYTKEDFTKGSATYDVVMDCVGNAPFSRVKSVLGADGRVFMVIGDLWQMIQAGFSKRIINGEEDGGAKTLTAEVIRQIGEMAEKGHLKPVIDSTFSLEQIVAAHARVDTGRKKGNVVLTLP